MNANMNRIQTLDIIRGLALLGILVVNILSFHSPHFLYGGEKEFYTHTMDVISLAFIDMFVQASFYPLFSLLFGIGIYIMYERLRERGEHSNRILIRRLIILCVIGMLHGVFVWYGDILLVYGVIGLISLLFLHKSGENLVKWAVSLLVFPAILMTLFYYSVRDMLDGYSNNLAIAESFERFSGNYSTIFAQNFDNWLLMVDPLQWIFLICTILPMFLLGMMMKKRGWIDHVGGHLSDLIRWLLLSFILFVLFKIFPYFFGMPVWLEYAQASIGGSFSSIFYFILLLITLQGRNLQFICRILSSVGKLSLTNYLLQSLICFFVFYGVGLNLYGKLQILDLLGIAIIIYSFQVIFSFWYEKRFYFGPFEWLYRSLTYQKRQPFRKKKEV